MLAPKNKNETELQQRDHEILEAIYERKQTIREYAATHSVTYEQVEDMLADALRRKKTALTYAGAQYSPPDDALSLPRQGFRSIPRVRTTTVQLLTAELLMDFEDLDAWMEID